MKLYDIMLKVRSLNLNNFHELEKAARKKLKLFTINYFNCFHLPTHSCQPLLCTQHLTVIITSTLLERGGKKNFAILHIQNVLGCMIFMKCLLIKRKKHTYMCRASMLMRENEICFKP
jgi:hypothetical protein